MDAGLKYKRNIIKITSKDLTTVIAFKCLKLTFPLITKQLFEAIIAQVLNYILNI